MKARAATVGRRLALGTWLQLEAWARWQFGADYAPGESGLAVSVRRLGVILRRVAGSVFVVVFYGWIVQRAYGAVYLVPVVWVIGAWQMSDTSATPPPREGRPSCRECAGHELVSVTPLKGQKGMSIYATVNPDRPNYTHTHVGRQEVNES